MAFDPKAITKKHILKAIEKIESENIELISSTRWKVEINGNQYPPKEVMRYAHEQMNGEKLWHRGGGEATNKFLEENGFKMIDMKNDPIISIIENYKNHLRKYGLVGELYKWDLIEKYRGKPDISVPYFSADLLSINYSNFIYKTAVGVMKHILSEREEAYRKCFERLLDENEPLLERVNFFNKETLKIYRELHSNEKHGHHQDERTMAVFLTYFNPDKYTLYKATYYQIYCKLIGVKTKKKNERYVHYLELIDDFIKEYIQPDNELKSLFRAALPSHVYQDDKFKILAQDILYRSLERQLGAERKYWRIGTTDGKSSYWELMQTDNKVCIGWSEIGDLTELEVQDKKEIIPLLEKGGYKNEKNILSRKAGEIFNFYNDIKKGDVVLAQDGHSVLGIGIVNGDYYFNENENFSHQLPVEWKAFSPEILQTIGARTTVYQLTDLNLTNKVDRIIENSPSSSFNKNKIPQMNIPLNQILFGPPGTGKTYHTIDKAIAIANPKFDLNQERQILKEEFDKLKEAGQIVFTTFHQSMSYEDFVEGIKPLEPKEEGGNVIYKVKDGIFKQLCNRAKNKKKLTVNIEENELELTPEIFQEYYQAFAEKLPSHLEEESSFELQTQYNSPFHLFKNSNNSIVVKAGEKRTPMSLSFNQLSKVFFEGKKPVYRSYEQVVINHILAGVDVHETEDDSSQKSYVLIIDEINRGNVSQIFGELITLIENSKREGRGEALEVILPYSKMKFSVPSNLYIIGTMNTADRSVEALDTALRRRFYFEEMPPKPELIRTEGQLKEENGIIKIENYTIDLSKLLQLINDRVEILLDKDHFIGHSFFMNVDGVESFKNTFDKQIIPLLQEYFYGDFGKISLVLGEGFCKGEKVKNISNKFAKASNYDVSVFSEKINYRITNVSSMSDVVFVDAIKTLLNQKPEGDNE